MKIWAHNFVLAHQRLMALIKMLPLMKNTWFHWHLPHWHLVSQLRVANQKGLNKKMQWSYQAASTHTLAMTPQQLLPAHSNGWLSATVGSPALPSLGWEPLRQPLSTPHCPSQQGRQGHSVTKPRLCRKAQLHPAISASSESTTGIGVRGVRALGSTTWWVITHWIPETSFFTYS